MYYDWPGNVRELQNAMERAVVLAEVGRTDLDELPAAVRAAPPAPLPVGPVKALETIEREYILAVLERNAGNQVQTAEQLDIGTATLYRKLKAYGWTNPRAAARAPNGGPASSDGPTHDDG